jgi:hypothetical protein
MDPAGRVRQYVRDDEALLWRGVPDAGVWFTAEDGFMIPFSILWCGFAIFWEFASSRGPALVWLWGIPFIAFGLYSVAGRFVYKSYRKRHTAYAITTYRAMIVGPRSFADLPLRDQPVTVKRSRDSRHASVAFGDALLPWSVRRSRWGPSGYVPGPNTGMDLLFRNVPQPFAFYDVASPDAMLRALDQARARPAG